MRELRFGPLDFGSIHLRVYSDAAFATNEDLSSQLGYIVIITDKSDRCHILDFSSKKSKRAVRSIMGGKTYAFMDAFDAAFTLRTDMARTLGRKLKVYAYTDSKQLFDAITKGKRTLEKRLSIDIAAARHAYMKFEIARIGLVHGDSNPADGLRKINGNGALLQIINGKDTTVVMEWIIRKDSLDRKSGECEN